MAASAAEIMAWLRGEASALPRAEPMPELTCEFCGQTGHCTVILKRTDDALGGMIACRGCRFTRWSLYRPASSSWAATPEDLA